MTIAVTTPTGHVGSRVVQLLIQAGVRPVLLVRDPDKLGTGVREEVSIEPGDLADAEYVLRATHGVDALLCVIPENFGSDDPLAEMTAVADNLAAAVRANGISFTLLISSVGAEKERGVGLIDGLAYAEKVLADAGTNVLILRNGYYFTNVLGSLDRLRAGVLSTTDAPNAPQSWVDPRDIGDIAAARLLACAWTGVRIEGVHGPADLTWTEATAILSDALGRDIKLQVDSDDDARRSLKEAGLSDAAVEGIVGMTAGLRGHTPEQPRTLLTTTPTTLGAWAYAHLRPLL